MCEKTILSRTTRTPEIVEKVREAVLKSPKRPDHKHVAAITIFDRTVKRILHEELKVSSIQIGSAAKT